MVSRVSDLKSHIIRHETVEIWGQLQFVVVTANDIRGAQVIEHKLSMGVLTRVQLVRGECFSVLHMSKTPKVPRQ